MAEEKPKRTRKQAAPEADAVSSASEPEVAEEPVAEEAVPEPEAAAEEPAPEAAVEPEAAAPEPEAAPAKPAGGTAAKAAKPRAEKPKATKPKRERPKERKPIVRLPKPEAQRGRRQERRGVVVSSSMDKTIVVKVDTVRAHARYKKVIRRSTKFHAHDEQNAAKVGDLVRIVETRPLSTTKRWRLAEIVQVAR
jgi:small subunit ribosomal protein S17